MKFSYKRSLILVVALLLSSNIGAQSTGEDIVIGQSFSLNSEVLNEERPYQIYLPSDYDKNAAPVSVLYLLDGDGHFHHTTGVVSFLKRQGRIPNLMVVSIPNTTDRTRDLTPEIKVDMEAKKGMPTAGGADNMLSFIKDELIPHIDKTYNTSPYRILIGHSLAHALHVVHAQSSSSEIKSLNKELLSEKSLPFLTISGPFSFILALRSIITFLGESFFPVIFAGQTSVHRPH